MSRAEMIEKLTAAGVAFKGNASNAELYALLGEPAPTPEGAGAGTPPAGASQELPPAPPGGAAPAGFSDAANAPRVEPVLDVLLPDATAELEIRLRQRIASGLTRDQAVAVERDQAAHDGRVFPPLPMSFVDQVPDPFLQAAIAEKTAAGLSPEQAVEVLKAQAEHDEGGHNDEADDF